MSRLARTGRGDPAAENAAGPEASDATDDLAAGDAADRAERRRKARQWAACIAAVAVVALGLRLWAPGPVTQTTDEVVWLTRSDTFRTAIRTGDFARATTSTGEVATMPGVTTMWAGTLGRAMVRGAAEVGLADPPQVMSERSPPVLRAARGVVALGCVVALAVIMWLTGRLLGRRVALVAGVILAVEPFLVGHSDVLHTDAMVTIFGAASVLALLAARVPARAPAGRRAHDLDPDDDPDPDSGEPAAGPAAGTRWSLPLVALGGLFAALTLLTKSNGVVTAIGGPGLVALAATVSELRAGTLRVGAWALGLVRAGAVWLGTFLVVGVALWPALWVAPRTQISLLRRSLLQVGSPNIQFFRGKITDDPGWTFYPVNLGFRLSPWLLVGGILAVVVVVVQLARRRPLGPPWILAVLLSMPAVYVVAILKASKKFDRYALPVVPFLAILLGVIVVAAVARARHRWPVPDRAVAAVALATTALLVAHTAVLAPYALSYVNPLVGGQKRAERTILLGWGEGTERLALTVVDREGAACATTRVAAAQRLRAAIPCALLSGLGDDVRRYDYVIVYITLKQRAGTKGVEAALRQHADVVDTFAIDGVVYATLWQVRDPYE